jgi:hypothetical protein
MNTGRLETSAHGVFAIAATLLILSDDSHLGSCAPVGATLARISKTFVFGPWLYLALTVVPAIGRIVPPNGEAA